MISIFDDFDDQVGTCNALFTDILDVHAPIKRAKIKARPNPFVTTEIRQLMKTRDQWHESAIKSNDRLHWNAYRFFRQEVKRELRFAEKAHVRSELLKCNGNTNAICLPKKKLPRPNVPDNLVALANKFNDYFTSVGCVTAQKASDLATEHNFDINPTTTVSTPDECPEIFQFHAVSDKMSNLLLGASPLTNHLAMIKRLFEYSRTVCQRLFRRSQLL